MKCIDGAVDGDQGSVVRRGDPSTQSLECTDYRGTQQLPQYIQMYSAWIANTWFREFLSGMSFMLYHKIILNNAKNVWCGDSFTTSRLANGESITCPPV